MPPFNPTAFLDKIRQTLSDAHISVSGQRVLVALSGGADSVCLLHALRELGAKVYAAHCNFHLRGEESNRDTAFVRELCQALGVPLFETSFDTASFAAQHGLSIEMAARQLRYSYFDEICRQNDLRYVCIGHHIEDNIETVFLNLLRGTGISGLRGMVVEHDGILRPLLHTTRQEIENYLQANRQTFVNDSSNDDRKYRRNFLRHEIMPRLRELNPHFDQTMDANLRHIAEADRIVVEFSRTKCGEYCTVNGTGCRIDLTALRKEPHGNYLLFDWLSHYGFNASQVEQIWSDFEQRTGALFEAADYVATICNGALEIGIRPQALSPVVLTDGITALADGRMIGVETSLDVAVSRDPLTATLDAQKICGSLYVRSAMEGDRFQPFGMKGTKLLSDFLTDRHRSRIEKMRTLVVCDDEGIVWVVGERISQRVSITADTRIMKVLRYTVR
ncbi:MAG: tRNA lysidine(34) synthetase TilS [Alloprevotella sp.]|nr:tRNA lysidine(34) synthetase TilS [Alloprevotella sp.]